MIKKIIFLAAGFFILAALNIFLIQKAYAFSQKQAEVERILAEIAQDAADGGSRQFQIASNPNVQGLQTDVTLGDSRVANLKAFFRKYNSPLYNEAELIVKVSYEYDYRLLPAIAMQESNLCRVIPDNSHNCWGWGIYGTTVTRFDSYDEAIRTVARGIKENYIDQGLVTASAIMKKYTPPSQGS